MQSSPFKIQLTSTNIDPRFTFTFQLLSGQTHRYIKIEVVAQQRLRVARDGVCRCLVRVEHVVIDHEPHLPPDVALLQLLIDADITSAECFHRKVRIEAA